MNARRPAADVSPSQAATRDTPDVTIAANDMTGRKARETAVMLPLLGLLLIIPPIVEIFAVDDTLFGVPVLAAYIFAAWAGMIGAAFLLSRALSRQPDRGNRGD